MTFPTANVRPLGETGCLLESAQGDDHGYKVLAAEYRTALAAEKLIIEELERTRLQLERQLLRADRNH
jgi:hypothetical protein